MVVLMMIPCLVPPWSQDQQNEINQFYQTREEVIQGTLCSMGRKESESRTAALLVDYLL